MSMSSINSFGAVGSLCDSWSSSSALLSSPKSSPSKRAREEPSDPMEESPTKKLKAELASSASQEKVKQATNLWFLEEDGPYSGSSCESSPEKMQISRTPPKSKRKLVFDDALLSESPRTTLIAQALVGALPESRQLFSGERETIAHTVDENLSPTFQPVYLSAGIVGCYRDLVIDPATNRFIVLSGEYSKLKRRGGERWITEATGFKIVDEQKVISTNLIHSTNLADQDVATFEQQLTLAELLYPEDLFFSIVHEDEKRISIFETKYDSNLQEAGMKRALEPREIVAVLRQVTSHLSVLHENGLAHGDITRGNVLIKDRDGDHLKAKLIDFGMAYSIDGSNTDWPKQYSDGYGSVQFSAPEYFGMSKVLDDQGAQSMAEDMFAMGCLLYNMLYPEVGEIPWDHEVVKAIEYPTDQVYAKAQEKFKNGIQKLDIQERGAERVALIEACRQLLCHDPLQRMTLDTFISRLVGNI